MGKVVLWQFYLPLSWVADIMNIPNSLHKSFNLIEIINRILSSLNFTPPVLLVISSNIFNEVWI